jgi:glyoxylase-like metal-dependent hydrolase (beta-lactamase superfamily II)
MTQSYLLHPATFKLDGGAMFGIIPKPLWEKKMAPDEFNRVVLSLRVWLIRFKDRICLVDTGIGDYHDPKFNERFAIVGKAAPLIVCLEKLHLKADDITDIVLTHLHFDHAGGIGEKLFPKARIHIHKSHYDYALNPTARDQGSFLTEYFKPVIESLEAQKRIVWHQGESGILVESQGEKLKFKTSMGHTPYLMHPYTEKYIYMADLVPTSAHLPIPWVMGYDISPGRTTEDKKNIYDFILSENLTMIFEHDPKIWGAKINDSALKQTEFFSNESDGPAVELK